MVSDVERRALGRAAAGFRADVGPITELLRPEQFRDRYPGLWRVIAQRFGERRDEVFGTVANRDSTLNVLRGEHAYGMPDDLGRQAAVRRVRQVIAEGDAHLGARRFGADHDHAVARLESEQEGHDG